MKEKIQILILEDSDDDKELLLRSLKKENLNFAYKAVQNAGDYQNALHSASWDLILSDYSLPDFDGVKALEYVKKKKLDIPFILISGVITEETAIKAMKAGANDYLLKENLQRLGPAIKRELKDAETRKQHRIAQRAVVESEKRLREAQRIAKLGNWEYDHSTGKMIWSDEIYSIIEMNTHHKELTYGSVKTTIHPEDRSKLEKIFLISVSQKEIFEIELRIFPGKNRIKHVRLTCEHVYDENDRAVKSVGVIQDINRSKQDHLNLIHSLKEKQVLLSEIHHRVKNNMGIIYSLMQLGYMNIDDEMSKNFLLSTVMRIRTLSLIYEKLYVSDDFKKVAFHSFIKDLLSVYDIQEKKPKEVEITTCLDEVDLNINHAIPAGLILNELISNVYNHAFKVKQENCRITIQMTNKSDTVEIRIMDNGQGLPEDVHPNSHPSTLGFIIVNALIKQLKGTLNVLRETGTQYKIVFRHVENINGSSGNIFPLKNSQGSISSNNGFKFDDQKVNPIFLSLNK